MKKKVKNITLLYINDKNMPSNINIENHIIDLRIPNLLKTVIIKKKDKKPIDKCYT